MAPDGKARKDLCARFAKYYDNDALSDFTIRCRQTTWKVHRFVLSLHSGALAACCSDGFKEAKEAYLDLSEHEHDEVEALVYYLYHLEYEVSASRDESYLEAGLFHIGMAVIADKYLITGLNALANKTYCEEIDAKENTTLALHALQAYSVPQATETIRAEIVNLIVSKNVLGNDDSRHLSAAMRDTADFAADLALEFHRLYSNTD